MSSLAFISYRRDETSHIAQALYLQLKQVFGAGQLFMDVHSIRVGEAWPERIRRRLDDATVLLVLIGPRWLTAVDSDGLRRIDDPTDWVRNELLQAFGRRIPVIPVVIDDKKNLPRPRGLPQELLALADMQAQVLARDPAQWSGDVEQLTRALERLGLKREPLPPQPMPSAVKRNMPLLSSDEVAAALEQLPEWEAWTDSLPAEYPNERQELRRSYTFTNFAEAIEFMNFVAPLFDTAEHHPRWENTWNVVRVRLTTWDAQNQITRYDVDVAHQVEEAYRIFRSRIPASEQRAIRLSDEEVRNRMAALPDWEVRDGALHRRFEFRDFITAFRFMTLIAPIAERMSHHPEWNNVYNVVDIKLNTHDVGGISDRDFALAARISEISHRFTR